MYEVKFNNRDLCQNELKNGLSNSTGISFTHDGFRIIIQGYNSKDTLSKGFISFPVKEINNIINTLKEIRDDILR